MGEDELGTIETLTLHKETMRKMIRQYRGRVVDSTGDNLLAEFASVVDAVQCAVEVQQVLGKKNETLPENRRMYFRIGINLGDVIEEGERLFGDGVNIAARVESLAKGGGISISGTAYDQLGKKLPLGYEYIGEQSVKNIEKPVRVYRILTEAEAAGKVIGEERPKPKQWRWAAIGGVVALILVAGALIVWNSYFRPQFEPASVKKMAYPLPEKPSIAVLPFDNMSGDPKQEYFSDGMTDQIITGLSKVPRLFVISRNSTFTYKGKPVKVKQVAEDLGVRYVLEGSVQRSGDRIRITAQLIDALKGNHLWADRYDRDLRDIFALQDEITMKILIALQIKLTEGEQARVYGKGTHNLKAYLLCLQADKEITSLNKDGLVRARQMVQEAIALDPNYARAYHFWALTYVNEVILTLTREPKKALATAVELEQKALALDNSLSWGHALLGWLYTLQRQHDKGITEGEEAIRLEPNSAAAHFYLSLALKYAGRAKESIVISKEAIRLDPIPKSIYYQGITTAYCHTGQYEEAIAAGKKAVELGPNNMVARAFLALAYSLDGKDEEASIEAKEVMRINPKFSLEEWAKTMPYKNQADRELVISGLRKAGLK
jgi:adenylate cyclase